MKTQSEMELRASQCFSSLLLSLLLGTPVCTNYFPSTKSSIEMLNTELCQQRLSKAVKCFGLPSLCSVSVTARIKKSILFWSKVIIYFSEKTVLWFFINCASEPSNLIQVSTTLFYKSWTFPTKSLNKRTSR